MQVQCGCDLRTSKVLLDSVPFALASSGRFLSFFEASLLSYSTVKLLFQCDLPSQTPACRTCSTLLDGFFQPPHKPVPKSI